MSVVSSGSYSMKTLRRAVILLSGGLDSYTVAALARRQGFELYALTIKYGQLHIQELEAARRVAHALDVNEHLELDVDMSAIGGSALTGEMPIPKDRSLDKTEIPATYVPARNTVFLALALGWAEVLHACDLFIGVNAVDYSGYPDCRPEYIKAFEHLAALATKAGTEGTAFHIHTPLIKLTKAEIVKCGIEMGLDYGLTHSCYDPGSNSQPCGHCDSCRLRARGFDVAGVFDPLITRRD